MCNGKSAQSLDGCPDARKSPSLALDLFPTIAPLIVTSPALQRLRRPADRARRTLRRRHGQGGEAALADGPIHTRAGRDELLVQLEDGVTKGGELLVGGGMGGRQKGWLLEPPVVAKPAGMTWANQIHYGYDELPLRRHLRQRLRQGSRPLDFYTDRASVLAKHPT
jgi:hypothetical protein